MIDYKKYHSYLREYPKEACEFMRTREDEWLNHDRDTKIVKLFCEGKKKTEISSGHIAGMSRQNIGLIIDKYSLRFYFSRNQS